MWANKNDVGEDEDSESSGDNDLLVMAFQFMGLVTKLAASGSYTDTEILLDTGSTMSVFKNKDMLLNLRRSKKTLRAFSNGGSQDSIYEGDFPGMFKVWYNPKSMLNILAFSDVRKCFRVTMDTAIENVIHVHLDDDRVLKFTEVDSGLYLLRNTNLINRKISAYSFLTLVKSNKANFTSRQVKRADLARKFRKYLGYPGYKRYFRLLETNYFIDCPLTVDDAKRALHIYGPDVEALKGKQTRARASKIVDGQRIEIPDTIKDLHPHIHLSADYFFVQGIAFLHSISRGYNMRTVEQHSDYKRKYNKKDMLAGIKKCVNMYHSRGLKVVQLNGDNKFASIEEELRPIKMNIVAAGEHVGDIERSGRTIKECTRCHVHRNPYERYPRVMVKGCVIKSIKDLNQLPPLDGISKELSPDTLITGRPPPNFNEVNKLNFGDYVQAYKVKGATNTNKSRTVGAIALYPSGNAQGGWVFMSLATGRELHCYQWDTLPVGEDVINRVHTLAIEDDQPKIDANFMYEWE